MNHSVFHLDFVMFPKIKFLCLVLSSSSVRQTSVLCVKSVVRVETEPESERERAEVQVESMPVLVLGPIVN